MDESKEAGSELVIANGDSAELLELEEEPFYKMAFLVKPPIDVPRISFIILGRDTEIRIVVGDELAKRPFAIGFISKDSRSFQVNSAEQLFSDSNVMNVAGGQHDLYRVAQSVHNGKKGLSQILCKRCNGIKQSRMIIGVSGAIR